MEKLGTFIGAVISWIFLFYLGVAVWVYWLADLTGIGTTAAGEAFWVPMGVIFLLVTLIVRRQHMKMNKDIDEERKKIRAENKLLRDAEIVKAKQVLKDAQSNG